MHPYSRLLRLTAIGLLAAAALAATILALPTPSARSDERVVIGPVSDRAPRITPESCGQAPARSETFAEQCSDVLWAQVGGLEAWYFENGYTQSPPPAAPIDLQHDVDRPIVVNGTTSSTLTPTLYLPLVSKNHSQIEFRGVWVSRFDWTAFGVAPTTSTIDTILSNVKTANFNAILFQVRGTADAFYAPGLEPWAARMTGSLTETLGVDPGWDPLDYLVAQAHAQDIQVHAYINVFPTWLCGLGAPPQAITPTHLFWSLSYSVTWDDWRVWTSSGPDSITTCDTYLWATPALSLTRAHAASVAADLATRYDIDGIHLDLIRYPGSNYSHDPFTRQAYTDALVLSPTLTFAQWQPGFQRAQVSTLVSQAYSAVAATRPDAWLSAAVWPNYASGYNSYFQDSKGWLSSGIIDANLPMLYSSDILNDLAAWIARMQGFVADSYGRFVIPGIHADYADFGDIVARIDAARAAGATGVSIFSYGALNTRGYFDDLGAGPFATPAEVPKPNWKP
jgi:uncharacterized lipoprotein YddW (UPF0748 family)